MQRFRYLTRMGNIVTSTDVDLILKEDNCLLVVNRGSMLNPKPSFARREQGLVIEKEQPIDNDDLPILLFDHKYLPTYYVGFTKNYISRLQRNVKALENKREEEKTSEEGMYNEFMRDLRKSRERWLIRQANVERVRESFEKNLRNNKISLIPVETKNNKIDINDVIEKSFSLEEQCEEPDLIDESEFIPVKKIKK